MFGSLYTLQAAESQIVFHDETLKKLLTLTTADLRFADHLVKSVSDDKGNACLDETGDLMTFCSAVKAI